ncbi:MAG: hypothetical protein LBR11_02600 [Deltaproteobacteria bacterium]|jgi:uncharacterized protein YfaS (alpha-2-macroglobulin family)|nr:hypothetical protein [Deltaproteobacteria bacterium]
MTKSLFFAAFFAFALALGGCDEPPKSEPSTQDAQPKPVIASDSGQAAPSPPAGEELKILQFLPAGPVKTLEQIVVILNQPMVALGQYENVPPGVLELDPQIPGQIRWLNEYTLAFVPEKPLKGSLLLRAKVNPGLKSLAGAALTEGAEITISLPDIQVMSSSFLEQAKPEEGFRAAYMVYFNQPLDLKTLADKSVFVVTDSEGQKSRVKALWRDPSPTDYAGQGYWSVVVESDSVLPPRSTFQLVAEPKLISLAGPRLSQAEMVLMEGQTPGPLRASLLSSCPQDSAEPCLFEPNDYFSIQFNNPVNFAKIMDFIEFDPPYTGFLWQKEAVKSALRESGQFPPEYDYNTNALPFWAPFRALTNYVVTIKAGAEDIYGQKMTEPQKLSFRTKAYEPDITFKQSDGFLETSSPPIVPVAITNMPQAVIQGYALSPVDAVKVMETVRDYKLNYEERRQRFLKLARQYGQSRQLTLRPPQGAIYGPTMMGVNLKELFAPDSQGQVLLLAITDSADQLKQSHFYQITDLGVTAKIGYDDGLVWVYDLSLGQSLAGVDLELRGPGDQVYWSGQTDATGLARLPGREAIFSKLPAQAVPKKTAYESSSPPSFYLIADYKGQAGVWNISQNGFDYWRYDIKYSSYAQPLGPPQYLNWLLSAQPIYLPGETARLKGISRLIKGDQIVSLQPESASLVILGPSGELVKQDKIQFSELGTFSYDLPLDPSAALGSYTVALITDPDFDPLVSSWEKFQQNGQFSNLGSFEVQVFRTPAFDLTFDPLPTTESGQKITVSATARYHFGSPVADNVGYYDAFAITAEDLAFPKLPGFSLIDNFANQPPDCDYCQRGVETMGSGQFKLDQAGRVSFDLTIPPESIPRPRKVEVILAATDVDQRVVAKQANFLAHPASLYVALKNKSALARVGSPVELDLAVVDLNGDLVAKTPVEIKLFRRVWQTVRRRSVGNAYLYQAKKVDEEISGSKLTSLDQLVNFKLDIPKSGQYFVQAKIVDSKGRPNQASVSFYAFGPGPVGWDFSNDDSLTMIPDQSVYKPGDTAKILVQSPFQSGQGLLTVERSGLRQVQKFELNSQSPVLEVPLSQADGPNVYVSVILTRGRISDQPDKDNVDLGKPTYRQGYLTLKVTGNPDLLNVKATPQKTEYRPQESVTVDLEVTDANGSPARGEVALVVVDAGLVQVGGEEGYYPEKEFFKPRPLMVTTFNNLQDLIGRRDWGYKGVEPGGGGGPMSARENNFLRANFQNLAHFEPFVQLDGAGRATVAFTLPDNLTTFKIYAIATGPGRQTGTGVAEILVTKNLLLRSALPAQAGLGDEFTASVIVSNRGPGGEAQVTANLENLELLEPTNVKTVQVAENSSQEVGFRVKANQPGPAFLTFEASLGQDSDAAKYLTPINYLSQLSSQAAFRELTPGETVIDLSLIENLDPTRGGLVVEISPTLAPFLASPWEYLANYPYLCLEQSTSRAFGALALLRVKNWKKTPPEEENKQREMVESQLRLIESRERGGGYALWASQTSWSDRNPHLSVFILDFLVEANKDGFQVPQSLLANTTSYVNSILSGQDFQAPTWYSSLDIKSLQIYAASVLAKLDSQPESFLESFYQDRSGLSLYELLSLTRGINALPRNRDRVEQLRTLLPMIANQINVGASRNSIPNLWVDEGQLTALTLLTLAEAAPYNQLIPGLIRSLSDLGRRGSFGSTQSNLTALLALSSYINKAESENPDLTIETLLEPPVADRKLEKVTFNSFVNKPISRSIAASALAGLNKIKFLTEGSGRAWASARLTFAPKEPDLRPVSANGITVSRSYAVWRPEPQNPGQTVFQRGQVVKVTVTFMTPVARHNLILEDRVPAGFEPINFSLKDSDRSLLSLLSSNNDDSDLTWHDHEEFWPNRVLATSEYVPAGVYTYSYLIRPATPGQYTVPGPKVEEMYFPENFGLGAGQKITVK